MKKIFVSENVPELHLVQGILESEGIATEMQNENLAVVLGEVPLTASSVPSLFVEEADFARARRVVDEYRLSKKTRIVPGDASVCPLCGSAEVERRAKYDYILLLAALLLGVPALGSVLFLVLGMPRAIWGWVPLVAVSIPVLLVLVALEVQSDKIRVACGSCTYRWNIRRRPPAAGAAPDGGVDGEAPGPAAGA